MPEHPFRHLSSHLAEVRRRIALVATHHQAPASPMATAFVDHLGQMLRPSLVLTASTLGGGTPPEAAFDLAALVELVHAASLLHDDVIDEADTRRGQPAMHHRYGARQAVLTGDLLLAHGLRLAAPHASPAVLATLANITRDLAKGQLLELATEGNAQATVEGYLEIIHRKTASFFGYAARLGGLAGDRTPAEVEALETYGTAVGFAYQILDDLLDVTADASGLGKPVGADFANGRPTLPVLKLLAKEPADSDLRQALVEGRGAQFAAELPRRIRSCGAFDEVVEDARGYCRQAEAALEVVGPLPGAEALTALLDYLFQRLAALTTAKVPTHQLAAGA